MCTFEGVTKIQRKTNAFRLIRTCASMELQEILWAEEVQPSCVYMEARNLKNMSEISVIFNWPNNCTFLMYIVFTRQYSPHSTSLYDPGLKSWLCRVLQTQALDSTMREFEIACTEGIADR